MHHDDELNLVEEALERWMGDLRLREECYMQVMHVLNCPSQRLPHLHMLGIAGIHMIHGMLNLEGRIVPWGGYGYHGYSPSSTLLRNLRDSEYNRLMPALMLVH
jgi:hypothetical protein